MIDAGQDRDNTDYPPLKPQQTGLRGRCPRCGQGALFSGFLTLRERCEVCDLDFGFADAADGPAFFVICLTCVPVVGFAVWMEVAMQAPYWLNALLTVPLLVLFCVIPLRPLKGLLIATQYYHNAREGRMADLDSDDGNMSGRQA